MRGRQSESAQSRPSEGCTHEDPRPAEEARGARHERDAEREQARERARERCATEEYTDAVLQHVARVP